jgi:hypothetical protein
MQDLTLSIIALEGIHAEQHRLRPPTLCDHHGLLRAANSANDTPGVLTQFGNGDGSRIPGQPAADSFSGVLGGAGAPNEVPPQSRFRREGHAIKLRRHSGFG